MEPTLLPASHPNEKEWKLIISFRGSKTAIPLRPGTTVHSVKSILADSMNQVDTSIEMNPHDIKLLLKGKVLANDTIDLYSLPQISKSKKDIKLIAMGTSSTEQKSNHDQIQKGLKNAPRIRDDLTPAGRRDMAQRRQLGRTLRNKANHRHGSSSSSKSSHHYKFHRIETLPMLPDQTTAKQLLTDLTNDPGIRACMIKHQFAVGCLAELYPEGTVGESDVCVMGLNTNKGQKISLRLRTDDLRGFRKMLSIRKVLFHELAHNVHSEHNGDFFQLMRVIEKDCNEMNWTKGGGQTSGGRGRGSGSYDDYDNDDDDDDMGMDQLYIGGSGRLGGGGDQMTNRLSRRELAGRAAMRRKTVEEEEIERNCGCDQTVLNVDNPTQSSTTLMDIDDVTSDKRANE